jgi:4-aminobutyrate aminotransferase-like enzyme
MTTATTQRHLLLHMTANGSSGPEGEDLLIVRGLQDDLAKRMAALKDLRIVGDVRGTGFFYSCELVGDLDDGGFSDLARADLIADLIPRRLREAGLLPRVCNRSAPLVQIAPPLISDRAILDRIAAIITGTLAEASARI